MSATIGMLAARTISFSAAVLSAVGQETRMMSAPASSQRRIWPIVALASSVGVLVMVWTLIGESPPTGTEPTMIWRDGRRSISRHGRMDMKAHIGARTGRAKSLRDSLARLISFCYLGLRELTGAADAQACPSAGQRRRA